MKRREFLVSLAAVPVVLSGCGADSDGRGSAFTPPPPLDEPLSRARHFRPLAGDVFYLEHPHYGSVDAVLASIEDNTRDPQLEQFVLTFELPAGSNLADGTYRLQHYRSGVFELFLQRSERSDLNVERHVALFSHLHDTVSY